MRDKDAALIEAVKALTEIGKGADEHRIVATEALVRVSELLEIDPVFFRLALDVMRAENQKSE